MLHHELKVIELGQSLIELPINRQIAIVREVIKGHQLDNPDPLPIYGEICGYEYIPDPEHRYPFNLKGALTGLNAGSVMNDHAKVKTAKKEVKVNVT